MENRKIVAMKGKLILDTSSGGHHELGFMIPEDVALQIQDILMNWEKEWVATTETHLEYQEVSKELSEKLKNKKDETAK